MGRASVVGTNTLTSCGLENRQMSYIYSAKLGGGVLGPPSLLFNGYEGVPPPPGGYMCESDHSAAFGAEVKYE